MKITIFESAPTKGKSPISPYGDKTFTFRTINCEKPLDAFRLLSNNFTLNISLDLEQPLRSRRRVQDLSEYYPKTTDWILIDADHIDSLRDQKEVLKYFKQYKCLIGESRSCNMVDNFNLKGFLFIKPLEINKLRPLIEQIQDDLAQFCEIDIRVAQRSALNAPTNKVKILLESNEPEYEFKLRTKTTHLQFENTIEIPKEFDTSNVTTIEGLCLKMFETMGFSALKYNNKCIIFKHPSEIKTPGGYFWFKDSPYIMNHYNKLKSINIYNEVIKLPLAKQLLQKSINYETELQSFNTSTNVIEVNEKFLKITDEIKEEISKFIEQDDGLFTIRSAMGTAKSVIIEEIIKQSNEQDLRVLICSNRISVAEDFAKKYNIKLYNKDKYEIGDSLIVQFDSLWKYNLRNFDLVILDEFISLMLHSRNTMNGTFINLSKLYACMHKKLVIADAFLTGFENKLLSYKKSNLHLLQNNYREDTKLFEYTDFNYFIQVIVKTARKNKVTISCTQLNVIKALRAVLVNNGVRVVTLTAETPTVTKELIYKLFDNNDNDKYDVLIYSPTLTVGVSNLNDICYHFHYDCSNTCDVISSLQMIKRTRKASEIHYYIKSRIEFVKTSFNDLKETYLKNLGTQLEFNFLFELNDYGEPRLSKLGKHAIYIDTFKNILEYNHKKAFEFLLQYQFKNKPSIVDKKYDSNILLPYIKEIKDENENKIEDAINEYILVSDADRNYIDIRNTNIFDILYRYETEIEAPLEIKNEILRLEFKKNIIEKCKCYNIIKLYSNDGNQQQIQIEISNAIMYNIEDVKFWNYVLKNINEPLKESYTVKEYTKLRVIFERCGYKSKITNHRKSYIVDEDILKYREYIK